MKTTTSAVILITVLVLAVAAIWGFSRMQPAAHARACLQNMKSISGAARLWAERHESNLPTNWICFSTDLVTPKLMVCPADSIRTPVADWARFGPDNSSYEMLGGGVRFDEPNRVFFRCKVHGYVCLCDGVVLRQAIASSR